MDLDSAQIGTTATGPSISEIPQITTQELTGGASAGVQNRAVLREKGVIRCLRCNSLSTVALDKMATNANTCYRCRACGHIFSPHASGLVDSGQSARDSIVRR